MINSAHAVDGLPIIVTQLVLIGEGFPDVELIMECEKLLPSALIGSHLWRIQATRLHVNAHALRQDRGVGKLGGQVGGRGQGGVGWSLSRKDIKSHTA